MKDAAVRKVLLVEAHHVLSCAASDAVAKIGCADSHQAGPADIGLGATGTILSYPPEQALSNVEQASLACLRLSPDERSAVRKLIADACASTLFQFFCLMDGVADPEVAKVRGSWLGARFAAASDGDDQDDGGAMLHDDFFEHYWNYKKAVRRSAP